ncbi:MAG: DUF3868 domain-containing protein, partial [Bacteroidales bacterium]|nr:DUF3868 domain-containing protein [Bacteroidales bacterium]
MKRIILIIIAFVSVAPLWAQTIFNGDITVKNFTMERNGDNMFIEMDLDMSDFGVSNNRVKVYTPIIVKGDKEQELYSVGIYGR